MPHDDHLAKDEARSLFGSRIELGGSVTWQLAQHVACPSYELLQWRLGVSKPIDLSWSLRMVAPPANDGLAAAALWRRSPRILLSPDGCWPHYLNTQTAQTCLAQGVALAWFDRLDFALDPPNVQRRGAFYAQCPDSDSGCLNVWAWGFGLTAQALREYMPEAKIAVIGHSRGGKAALLCAARYPEIDAVVANNSGTGGAASLAVAGEGAESLAQLASAFPHWLAPQAQQPVVQERLREIDGVAWWSRIAPRPLLIMQAQGDAWGNPLGTRHAYTALRPLWPQNSALTLVEREGAHAMEMADWHQAALFIRQPHPGWQ